MVRACGQDVAVKVADRRAVLACHPLICGNQAQRDAVGRNRHAMAPAQQDQPAKDPDHEQVQQTDRHEPRSCLNSRIPAKSQVTGHVLVLNRYRRLSARSRSAPGSGEYGARSPRARTSVPPTSCRDDRLAAAVLVLDKAMRPRIRDLRRYAPSPARMKFRHTHRHKPLNAASRTTGIAGEPASQSLTPCPGTPHVTFHGRNQLLNL